jgi:histidine triad (HIT) family protein
VADCLFCKIVDKEMDSDIVHESDDVVAFRDLRPAGPTHLLVVPRRHVASAAELTGADSGLLGALFEAISSLARSEGLDGGYRVVTNVGPDAGQSVSHLHFHLIGGRRLAWPPG